MRILSFFFFTLLVLALTSGFAQLPTQSNPSTAVSSNQLSPETSREEVAKTIATLLAENEKLKRHLDNITNQTERFQQDRHKAEDKMKAMVMNKDTTDDELNQVIREYSEAYSDYGKRRHEELSFHLDQLQKYVLVPYSHLRLSILT